LCFYLLDTEIAKKDAGFLEKFPAEKTLIQKHRRVTGRGMALRYKV